ncbi:glycosyltransferase family 2 protein [Papillibacter cinnamivorans]|uniref:Glycosyl transferase family 2 n=1 Tax=Papillibacter cinnamivorans DSM 12816 TaxID=1122930 RepID=A0A1W2C0S8_9FIRM|nr:glycosyltransferase family A protein [Papillibacter cinnamivorans]SMC78614.1 Glycosyl transferase family 2 [Papillibacter cinnamivorans DSM 12816]
MPRISVIVPCYNYGRFLSECLESLFAQTFRDFEVLVVDDGSEDYTREAVRNFPAARYFYQEHHGISSARNRGLREAGGECIAFLDADDLWLPDKLEKQAAYLDAHPECNLVFTRMENFYDGDPALLTETALRLLNTAEPLYLPSACIRSVLFQSYGGFREELPHGEDTEWVMRAGVCGEDLGNLLEEVLYRRRIHGGNITLTHNPNSAREYLKIAAAAIHSARKLKRTPEKPSAGRT